MGQANLWNRGTHLNGAPGVSGLGGLGYRVRGLMVAFLAVGAAALALGVSAASATTWNLPATDLSAAGQGAGELCALVLHLQQHGVLGPQPLDVVRRERKLARLGAVVPDHRDSALAHEWLEETGVFRLGVWKRALTLLS